MSHPGARGREKAWKANTPLLLENISSVLNSLYNDETFSHDDAVAMIVSAIVDGEKEAYNKGLQDMADALKAPNVVDDETGTGIVMVNNILSDYNNRIDQTLKLLQEGNNGRTN